MSRTAKWTFPMYLGVLMLLVGSYPFMDTELENSHAFEAGWHLWLFTGAACLVFGVERLRRHLRRFSVTKG